MSIGERLKLARQTSGMSQRALAETAGVSAMAISKYERGQDTPSSGVLLRLAQTLGVKVEYYLRPVSVSLSVPAYRRRTAMRASDQEIVVGQTQEWLERYLDIESLFNGDATYHPPQIDCRVTTLADVERVAEALRAAWNLGLDPIESMVEVLEGQGIKVGVLDGVEGFDALTLWAYPQTTASTAPIPVIVVKRNLPGDRQRFNLAHELGHLVLKPASELDEEKAAYRFAGAFLIPTLLARSELGTQRRNLNPYELHLLKHKYGVSMQAWIYRARDLGIISEAVAVRLFRTFRQEGWHRKEPGDPFPPETTDRMKRLVLRALAEDVISPARATELLGMPLAQFWRQEAAQHDGFPLPVYR